MNVQGFVYMAMSSEDDETRGTGVVLVDTDRGHARYTPCAELEPPAMRQQMQAALEADLLTNFFILQKTATHVHVFTYPRDQAYQELKSGTLPLAPPLDESQQKLVGDDM